MPKYYQIPQCPRCQSWKTGRYIKSFVKLSDKEIAIYFKKGERVRPAIDYFTDNLTHMYCEDCNAKWEGYVYPINLSYEELKKEKEKRGIDFLDPTKIKTCQQNKKINKRVNNLKKIFINIKNFLKN